MKFFRFIFFQFGLVINITRVFAQPAYIDIKPSVNTQQFFSVVSATNSLHSGQLAVNIPLFNLQGRGINVPISINFNAEGITHYSDASNIGLGWSLLAGGVITRTIRGYADEESGNYSNHPWHYNEDYLANKLWEAQNNNEDYSYVLNGITDSEEDLFSYSFLGYTGDISVKFNADGSIVRTLLPDQSFRMEKIATGYIITTNDGTEYIFEGNESRDNNVMSWFLTEIKTLQGGKFKFTYEIDGGKSKQFGENSYFSSQRITRIDFDFGYVLFPFNTRSDLDPFGNTSSKMITGIELYDINSLLIKGYKFAQSYFTDPSVNKWLRLDDIREFDSNKRPLPPYKFEYDYKFSITPAWPPDLAVMSWAHNPAGLASMDRTFNGDLCPWMSCEMIDGICRPYAEGYDVIHDEFDGSSIDDYLSLTQIQFPSGGSEKYYYEPHDYRYLSTSRDFVQPDNYIQGKRLYKKEIIDKDNISQTVLYTYCIHDENHLPMTTTSGVLVNPSIHATTLYTVLNDINEIRPRLKAFPYRTKLPQNDRSLSPVLYSEVDEFSEGGGGRKVYYFERVAATPAVTYFCKSYSLVSLENTLYGKQMYDPNDKDLSGLSNHNYTYLAYPLGRFYIDLSLKGKVIKEVWLNSSGALVKKIDNEYTPGWPGPLRYGLIVKKFGEDSNPYYLISHPMTVVGSRQLIGRTTTNYFGENTLIENETFAFNNLNLPSSSSITSSKKEKLEITYKYANDRPTNISTSTTVLDNMIAKNMVGIPLKTEKTVDDVTKEGSITNYGVDLYPSDIKTLAGDTYEDKIIFDLYDLKGNILQYHKKSDYYVSFIWGYNQAYPVAKIEGMAYSDNLRAIKEAIMDHTFSGKSDYTSVKDDILWLKNQLATLLADNSCMVTFYTYAPFIGKTSQTDPNGKTTYYEYDNFGRLKLIRDNDGNILTTYEYNYKK